MKPLLHVTAADSPLPLACSFWPEPNPIRASPSVQNPWTIDLRVTVSNPSVTPVEVESIVIEFPLGEDHPGKLSGDSKLPRPILETPGAWSVERYEDPSVIIEPEAPATKIVFSGNPLIFLLPGIKVNSKPGTFKIEISQKVITAGGTTELLMGEASLEKQISNFPVESFFADPAAVEDVEKPVLLKWTCTPEGANRSFQLRGPADLKIPNCTCADGVTGKQVRPPATSTYKLEVMRGTEVQQTLYTQVEVAKVSLESTYHLEASPSGRMVNVGWQARNAVKCTVRVNNVTVDDNAPADTYSQENRYELLFAGENGPGPGIDVVAAGVSGAKTSRQITNTFNLQSPMSLQISGVYNKLRIAPTGKLALLIPQGFSGDEIIIADLVNRAAEKKRIPIADVYDATFSSNGQWVLAAARESLVRIEVATGATAWTIKIPAPLIGPGGVYAVRLTPDDKRAFVLVGMMAVKEVELPTGKILNTYFLLPGLPMMSEMALSADGKKIAVMRNDLHLIDLSQTPPVTKRIYATDGIGTGFSMTPDGSLAVAVEAVLTQSNATYRVNIIDLKSGNVDRIPLDEAHGAAILSNGKAAIIATENGLKLVDIPRKTIKDWGLAHGRLVAVSPTHFAVVAGHSGVFVI